MSRHRRRRRRRRHRRRNRRWLLKEKRPKIRKEQEHPR